MQQRFVAIATALTFLLVGLFARHHEAEAAHVREQSGRIVHAQSLSEHHEVSTNAHLHGREVHKHTGDCSLLVLAHAPLLDAAAVVIATPVASSTPVVVARALGTASTRVGYRIAPKTSPPQA